MFLGPQELQLQWVVWVPPYSPLSGLFVFLMIGSTHVGVMDPRSDAVNLEGGRGSKQYNIRSFPSRL
jgi:hypothetical protein